MGLPESVRATFDPQGHLAHSVVEFRPRRGQLQMAEAVAETIDSGGILVVEAGTGIGKTYAYLVPALLSGTRVLVSTATKALQDQLYLRDIPTLMDSLGLPLRVAMLKGRSSYLCLHRMQSAIEQEPLAESGVAADLRRIVEWAHHTQLGDLSEVLNTDDNVPVYSMVSSTRDNCLGTRCLQYRQCHVYLARKLAMEADVVVINHHLFFADLNIRESGVAELLPTVGTVIFDEAHQLNDIGVQFLGTQWSTQQMTAMCRDVAKHRSTLALCASENMALLARVEHATQVLYGVVVKYSSATRLPWVEQAPQGVEVHAWVSAMQAIDETLTELVNVLALAAPLSIELTSLYKRGQGLQSLLERFAVPPDSGCVRWIEVGHQLRLLQSPIDIAQDMQMRVLNNAPTKTGQQKAWIFTSATLGHDSHLSWFVDSCGLQGCKVLRLDSPFDHATQSALYIPSDFPKPSEPSHTAHVAALVADAASVLGGRTMVLTTTLRAMHAVGNALSKHFSGFDEIEVLVQGHRSKQELLQRFVAASGSPRGCVLIGAATFWEGIDLPGEALQLLVIDKLPFVPPGDPLLDARAKRTTLAGKSAFQHVHLPLTAIALKQGAGRLIRRESDQGVLVVCDIRMREMAYGRKLLAALPPMRKVETHDAFIAELNALTKLSTRGPRPP